MKIKSLLMVGLLSASMLSVGCQSTNDREDAVKRYSDSIYMGDEETHKGTQKDLEELTQREIEKLAKSFGNPQYEKDDDSIIIRYTIDKEVMENYNTKYTESALRLCQYLKELSELNGEEGIGVFIFFDDPNYSIVDFDDYIEFEVVDGRGGDTVIFCDYINDINQLDVEKFREKIN